MRAPRKMLGLLPLAALRQVSQDLKSPERVLRAEELVEYEKLAYDLKEVEQLDEYIQCRHVVATVAAVEEEGCAWIGACMCCNDISPHYCP